MRIAAKEALFKKTLQLPPPNWSAVNFFVNEILIHYYVQLFSFGFPSNGLPRRLPKLFYSVGVYSIRHFQRQWGGR